MQLLGACFVRSYVNSHVYAFDSGYAYTYEYAYAQVIYLTFVMSILCCPVPCGYTMLCYAMLCAAMPCYVVLSYVVIVMPMTMHMFMLWY